MIGARNNRQIRRLVSAYPTEKGMTGFSFYSFGVALFAFILYLVI